jgi:hypothetical protein
MENAAADRERAICYIRRLSEVKMLDELPLGTRAAAVALFVPQV